MTAVEELMSMMLADDPFVADDRDDHAALRLAAANERFAQQRPTVPAITSSSAAARAARTPSW
jgi:hypothetical protein